MPQITAWQCDDTKAIFASKIDYGKHLRKIAAQKRAIAKAQHIRDTYVNWLDSERAQIYDINEVVPWLLKNQRHIMDAVNAIPELNRYPDKFHPKDILTNLKLTLDWRQHASNSHQCPRNGVTNWCAKDKSKPTGYPGWIGRASGTLERIPSRMGDYPASAFLNAAGIYTGGGGGGNTMWGFEVTLFNCEWPGLSQLIVADILTGKITI